MVEEELDVDRKAKLKQKWDLGWTNNQKSNPDSKIHINI